MSDAIVAHDEGLLPPRSAKLRDWLSVHAWSGRQRSVVVAAIAATAALGAGTVCVEADLVGLQAARRELADAERGFADAQRAVARLPLLRQAVSAAPRSAGDGTAADDVRRVSELTSAAGLTLVTLEPLPPAGAAALLFRPMKLVAQGGFAQVRAFLAALAKQPGLVVPDDLSIQRDGDGVSLAATLQVFDGLPPMPFDEPRPPLMAGAADPFAGGAGDGMGGGALRLAGVMEDRARVVALIETAAGTEAVQAGQTFAGGRVERVQSSGVVLTFGGQTQTLAWRQEAK